VSTPVTTYRIQLRDGLTLHGVIDDGWLDHACDLGASHLYLSPVLTAAPGSSHGYDVVDTRRVDPALGGDAAFDRLAREAAERGMGLVVDVVPNHMAADPGSNPWWWDVLRHGPTSEHAHVFDVDLQHPEVRLRGRIVLPILDDRYGRVLDAGRLRLARRDGQLVVLIDDERPLPLSPCSVGAVLAELAERSDDDELRMLADAASGLDLVDADRRSAHRRAWDAALAGALEDPTRAARLDEHLERWSAEPDRVHELLEQQHHRLAYWRSARDLGYRRFFDVNELVAVRVEHPAVFDATHTAVRRWVGSGAIDGLRVDHPDGLLDPAGYFRRLRDLVPDGWIVAEKILEHGERLPAEWEVDGTTGYDVAAIIGAWFVEPEGLRRLGALRDELVGPSPGGARLVADGKRLVLSEMLSADLNRATDAFLELCESLRRFRDVTRHELHEILREVVVAYPVYRTYVPPDTSAGDRDLGLVTSVLAAVGAAHPELDGEVLDLLASVLTGRLDADVPAARVVRARVEQLTGPAMAKGKEDTAFYRELRLVSRCEVGDDPFASGLDTPVLHATMEQLAADAPRTMTALTTHDTKRSEDVRARLSVLSEVPEAWAEVARAWMARTATLDADAVLAASSRYRLLQNLVGAHPIGVDRLEAFALKAEREAKEHTSWTRPDPGYEAALVALVRTVCEDQELDEVVSRWVGTVVDPPGRRSEVAQKVLQLTAPGVADLYWGSEDRLHRLVDPDNRVAPDLAALRARLARVRDTVSSGAVGDDPDGPEAKLFAVATVVELRRRHTGCFVGGAYEPLEVVGDDAERIAAFRRGHDLAVLVTRWPVRGPVRADTTVELPSGAWQVRLGAVDEPSQPRTHGGIAPVAELLGGWSAAVLERIA
jgi:(1->4)-alpha-D-glucan 1-alpha-D-glucosylmutase